MKADSPERLVRSIERSIKKALVEVEKLVADIPPITTAMEPIKIVERYKINRFGVLVTHKDSRNQCKEEGHTHYRYQISAVCDTKLDSENFIINHLDIDRVVQQTFLLEMDSCEVLLKRMLDAVHALMNNHGVKVFELYGKLAPILQIPSEEHAFLEMTRTIHHEETEVQIPKGTKRNGHTENVHLQPGEIRRRGSRRVTRRITDGGGSGSGRQTPTYNNAALGDRVADRPQVQPGVSH